LASRSSQSEDQTPSWVNICGGTYLFSENAEAWAGANGECELYDSHLLQIDNLAENFCLLDYAHTVGMEGTFWHSANDIQSEGVWRQYDGTLIDWTPWWQGLVYINGVDPNGGERENCAAFILDTGSSSGQWFDAVCTASYRYICERGL